MTDANDLRTLEPDELVTKLREAKDELFKLRFGLATGQLDDSTRLSLARREIARMHTLRREREIAAHEAMREDA
jgi:large subunit ribosomal protein L29